jgi:hypothetical protein
MVKPPNMDKNTFNPLKTSEGFKVMPIECGPDRAEEEKWNP